jgi:hypothetical protein
VFLKHSFSFYIFEEIVIEEAIKMSEIILKKCNKCGKELPLTSQYFETRKESKDGYRNDCKECRNIRRREIYDEKYKSNNTSFWTKEEEDILIKYYPFKSSEYISDTFLNLRTPNQITDHSIKKLNLKKDLSYIDRWSEEQINYLKENYENLDIDIQQIEKVLDKKAPTIYYMAKQIGLSRKEELKHTWSNDEKNYLINNYINDTGRELKRYIDKPIKEINRKARNLKLGKKTKECIEKHIQEYISFDLKNRLKNKKETKPQIIINKLLDENMINYENEVRYGRFLMDNYLIDSNLALEVQGNFYHCNPTMYKGDNIEEKKIIAKDIRKHSYLKNKNNIEILYLWEYDILKNLQMCKSLILEYIKNNGILENYHSFNYILNEDSTLSLIKEKHVIGY